MSKTDPELLREYAAGSQDAFTELVRRHLDLVYSAARRQTRSAQMAEEVTQHVFINLARSARKVNPATPLAAWLHLTTRHTAINAARDESRRRAREQTALELSAMNSVPSAWTEVEPLLDEAVAALPDPDRSAILLRYFENKSLREIGAALGTSEDAAQKRVSRAIDQLRSFLGKRGVAVTAASLATDLSAYATETAPTNLGAMISIAARTIPATGGVLVSGLVLMKTKLVATLAVIALLAIGVALFEAGQVRKSEAETGAANQMLALLRARLRTLENAPRAAVPTAQEPATRISAEPGIVQTAPTPAQEELTRLGKLRLRWGLLGRNEDVVGTLGMTGDKTKRLRALLLDRSLTERDGLAVVKALRDLTPEQRGRALEQALAGIDAEIAVALGPDDYARYLRARNVANARTNIPPGGNSSGEIGGAMIDAGFPLEPEQSTRLAVIMTEMQADIKSDADRARFQADLLLRSAAVLNPSQVQALRQFFELDALQGQLMKEVAAQEKN